MSATNVGASKKIEKAKDNNRENPNNPSSTFLNLQSNVNNHMLDQSTGKSRGDNAREINLTRPSHTMNSTVPVNSQSEPKRRVEQGLSRQNTVQIPGSNYLIGQEETKQTYENNSIRETDIRLDINNLENPQTQFYTRFYGEADILKRNCKQEQTYRGSVPVRLDKSIKKFNAQFVESVVENYRRCKEIVDNYSMWSSIAEATLVTATAAVGSAMFVPGDHATKEKVGVTVGTLIGLYELYDIKQQSDRQQRANLFLKIAENELLAKEFALDLSPKIYSRYMALIAELKLESIEKLSDFFTSCLLHYCMIDKGDPKLLRESCKNLIPKVGSKLFSGRADKLFRRSALVSKENISWTIEGALKRAPICLPDGSVYLKEDIKYDEETSNFSLDQNNSTFVDVTSTSEKSSESDQDVKRKKEQGCLNKIKSFVTGVGEKVDDIIEEVKEAIEKPDSKNRDDKYPFIILDTEDECIANNYERYIKGDCEGRFMQMLLLEESTESKIDSKMADELYTSKIHPNKQIKELMSNCLKALRGRDTVKDKAIALERYISAEAGSIVKKYCKNRNLDLKTELPIGLGQNLEIFFAKLNILNQGILLMQNDKSMQMSMQSETAGKLARIQGLFCIMKEVYRTSKQKIDNESQQFINKFKAMEALRVKAKVLHRKEPKNIYSFSHIAGTFVDVMIKEPIQDNWNAIRHIDKTIENTCTAFKIFRENPRATLRSLCEQANNLRKEDPVRFGFKSASILLSGGLATGSISKLTGKNGIGAVIKTIPFVNKVEKILTAVSFVDNHPIYVLATSTIHITQSTVNSTLDTVSNKQPDNNSPSI